MRRNETIFFWSALILTVILPLIGVAISVGLLLFDYMR